MKMDIPTVAMPVEMLKDMLSKGGDPSELRRAWDIANVAAKNAMNSAMLACDMVEKPLDMLSLKLACWLISAHAEGMAAAIADIANMRLRELKL